MAADVHVQEVAGTGPRVTRGGLPLRRRWPRESVPTKHLPDGRVSKAGRGRDQAGPPAGAAAAGADPLLQRGSELARRAARAARAVAQTRAATAGLLAGSPPPDPPPTGRPGGGTSSRPARPSTRTPCSSSPH